MQEETAVAMVLSRLRGALPDLTIDFLRPRLRVVPQAHVPGGTIAATTFERQTGRYRIWLALEHADDPPEALHQVLLHELLHIAAGDLLLLGSVRPQEAWAWQVATDVRINETLDPEWIAHYAGVTWSSVAAVCEPAGLTRETATAEAIAQALLDQPGQAGRHPHGLCVVEPGDRAVPLPVGAEALERLAARAAAEAASAKGRLTGVTITATPRAVPPLPPAAPDPVGRALAALLARLPATGRRVRRTWGAGRIRREVPAPWMPRGRVLRRQPMVAVLVDVSASLTGAEPIVARIAAGLTQASGATLRYAVHSNGPLGPWRSTMAAARAAGDPGSGGTAFAPAYAGAHAYDAIVHITDGECADQPPRPAVPIVVVLTPGGQWRPHWRPLAIVPVQGA